MATLADMMRQNKPGMKDEAAGTAATLRAKSGKATRAGTGPARSQIAEKMAVSQARSDFGAVQTDKQLTDVAQAGQAADQAQQIDLAKQNIEQSRVETEAETQRQVDALFQDLEQNRFDINSQEAIAKQEQLGFVLGLQDEKYMHELQMVGARNRLDDAASFKVALQEDVLAGYEELFKDNLEFKSMFNADKRDFADQLMEMDISMAMELADAAIKAENQKAMIGGISQAGVSGVGYAAEKGWLTPDKRANAGSYNPAEEYGDDGTGHDYHPDQEAWLEGG